MRYLNVIVPIALLLVVFGCGEDKIINNYYSDGTSQTPEGIDGYFTVTPAKWYNGYSAAVSLNFDIRWRGVGRDSVNDTMINEALNRNLKTDIELVTAYYTDYPTLVEQMHTEMETRGVRFFGHGHQHDNHDNFDFDYCLNSFSTCYDYMKAWGFIPRSYAYPNWAGRKATTQAANELAGFIAARGREDDPEKMYICPDDEKEPADWYFMPCAAAGDTAPYIMSHDAMGPIIGGALDKKAYLIITYHSVGYPEGWGYYPLEDYKKDLDQIAAGDYWAGNMDDVVCYIKERNAFRMESSPMAMNVNEHSYKVTFEDGLDNTVFAQQLTLDFDFVEGAAIDSLRFDPPINGVSVFVPENNSIRLNVLPDERKYLLTLYSSEK